MFIVIATIGSSVTDDLAGAKISFAILIRRNMWSLIKARTSDWNIYPQMDGRLMQIGSGVDAMKIAGR
ncbi:MAG: hypothetical protein GX811_13450 [Lentisphaerae bacterium]|nr:hypothetical protein [Lentisphaerota bacterium]